MSTTITGSDPNAPSWPILSDVVASSPYTTRPTGDALSGGSYPSLLASRSDATWINEKGANVYYTINVNPIAIPSGARMIMMSPFVRARLHTGNTKFKDFLLGYGDHSDPILPQRLICGVHCSIGTSFTSCQGPTRQNNSQGNIVTQDDLNKGIYILLGGSTAYGQNASASGWDISQAYMQYEYDLPPTCNITFPAPGSTISSTAAPVIVWDYADDFQVQAKYHVIIYSNGTTNVVYDSGIVTSSDTFHAVANNLPNAAYDVSVLVYQQWGGPGGDFPALAADINANFTISTLTLGTPRVTTSLIGEHAEVTVYPDVNLLTFNGSTADLNALEWPSQTNCTIAEKPDTVNVRDGSGSLKITINLTGGGQFIMNTLFIPCKAGQKYKAMAYINPLALAGRQATLQWYITDIHNTVLSSGSGTTTALTANTWNQITGITGVAPAGAAFISIGVGFSSTTNGDILYADDMGIWHWAGTNTLPVWTRGGFYDYTPNILSYADSTFESGSTAWQPDALVGNTTMAIVGSPSLDGNNSIAISRSATGSGTAGIALGATGTIPCTPGVNLFVGWHAQAGSTIRFAEFGFNWFTAAGAFISYGALGSNDAVGSWGGSVYSLGGRTPPAGAAFAQPAIQVLSVTGTAEFHYVDAILVSRTNSGAAFYRGFLPATDVAPTLLVEYSDDGGATWHQLYNAITNSLDDNYVIEDYTIKSGVTRSYRASLREVENNTPYQSPYSAIATATLSINQVWMHVVGSESATSYNFVWDGGGRTRTDDSKAAFMDIEGLPYQFAQFGVESISSIDVTLHLDNASDIAAMQTLAKAKSPVAFRDQRGRSVIATMGAVKQTDAVYGVAADATFTLQLTGNQP